jgi:hypothetical protein
MACGSGRLLADLIARKKPQISAEGLDISRYGNSRKCQQASRRRLTSKRAHQYKPARPIGGLAAMRPEPIGALHPGAVVPPIAAPGFHNQNHQKAAAMRPARALIDLQALRHNYRLAREVTGAKALAVIKADAYGHGAVRCAQALEAEADGFAVACIEEALELRAAGIGAGAAAGRVFEADELALIVEHDFWCVVHSLWQLEAIEGRCTSRSPSG